MPEQGESTFEDAALHEWRRRTLDIVLPLFFILSLPFVALAVFSGRFPFAPGARAAILAVWAGGFALGLIRRLSPALRGWGTLLPVYAMAALSLDLLGLAGSARVMLVGLPVLAVVLLGVRSGIVAAVLGMVLYAAFALHAASGGMDRGLLVRDNPQDWSYWAIEGIMMAAILGANLVLLARLHRFQSATLRAERATADRLKKEIVARQELEEALLRVAERERRHTGIELHDGICQHILGALLRLKVAQGTAGAEEAASVLEAARGDLSAALREAKDLSRGLAPGSMAGGALVPALQELARSIREAHTVDCRFEGGADTGWLPDEEAMHLYRIAQEGVMNALKHARAGSIRIGLIEGDGEVVLTVADDGKGLTEGGADPPKGMGLSIMRARAAVLKGTLDLEGSGGGTRVVCRFPRPAPRPEPPPE